MPYSETSILAGFLTRLGAIGLSQPVAWPNVTFTPPSSGGYLRANILPATTLRAGIPPDSPNRHTGLFQVSVFWPEGQGEIAPSEIAGQIIAAFKHGTSIQIGNSQLRINDAPYRNPAIQEPGWYSIPVRIPYVIYADNPA